MDVFRTPTRPPSLRLNSLTNNGHNFPALRISMTETGWESNTAGLRRADIRSFFRRNLGGTRSPSDAANLNLVCVPMYMWKVVLKDIIEGIGADPWFEHLIETDMYGYHHLPSTSDSCGPSFHLATTFGTAIWTTRHVGSLFSTNCVYFYNTAKIWPYELQGHILDDFEHSKIYSPSMLYAPFIFTIDSLRWCELTLQICLKTIRGIESKTGHGSWVPISKLTIEDIEQLTGTLGTSLNVICNIHRHANIIESVWEHHKELSGELLAVSGCDKVHAIDKTIISAIEVFQQELENTRIQAQFLEQRVRSQTSVVSLTFA